MHMSHDALIPVDCTAAQFSWASDRVVRMTPTQASRDLRKQLHTWQAQLHAQPLVGVIDVTTGSSALTVVIDPVQDPHPLVAQLAHAIDSMYDVVAAAPGSVTLPVCFEAEYALDIDAVAAHTKQSRDAIVDAIASTTFHVDFLGFAPGFPYLSGLPDALGMSRLDTPRVTVPKGSVGIAGHRAGVYPCAMPGGWRIIGRTPQKLFATDSIPPTLFDAGDKVIFEPITAEQFRAMSEHDA